METTSGWLSGAKALVGNTRLLLTAGFGGLIVMMTFAGIDGIRALGEIQSSSDRIQEDFLLRTRVLERIRFDLYVSGTYARDYLLEPGSGEAEAHRQSLVQIRREMEGALRQYRTLLPGDEREPLEGLLAEIANYWKTLGPVLEWTARERQERGWAFLRDEVFPRRTAMLRIADRIGALNEAQLNAGKARVRETFTRFRNRLAMTLGLTVGLGCLLAAFSVRRVLALESEAAGRYREVSAARSELKGLSARLVEAQENERRAISRELHDAIGQALTGTLVEMANLSRFVRAGDLPAIAGKADDVKREIEQALSVVRNMALLLRPSMLDDLGLVPALQWQAREMSRRSGLKVKITAENVPEDLPEEHKTCIYRVAQEALHNARQHAGAQSVQVTVGVEGEAIVLAVRDDGKGFRVQDERGLGLIGMEERVGQLGGSIVIDSSPGAGTAVKIRLPVPLAHTMEAAT